MFYPVEYNLPTVITGCTYEYTMRIKLGETIKDLTGCTPKLYLLKRGELLVNDATSCITADTSINTINIRIPASITSKLPIGNLDYRIEITEKNNDVYRYMFGTLGVKD